MTCCCCCRQEEAREKFEDELADLQETIREAIDMIRGGNMQEAVAMLGKAANDPDTEKERKKEEELATIFDDWRKQPLPRPDFLTFAHKRRKWSAT